MLFSNVERYLHLKHMAPESNIQQAPGMRYPPEPKPSLVKMQKDQVVLADVLAYQKRQEKLSGSIAEEVQAGQDENIDAFIHRLRVDNSCLSTISSELKSLVK